MIPLSLRLRNFMSYGEDVPPLDFSLITTACITGDNGHGKSALLDAITWALWGQTRAKNLDDIVRLGQDEAEVEIVFELEDERYRVLRKRSRHTRAGQSALELQGFDKATQRYRVLSGNTIRETEAKIVQLLHMNYDTFINSVFILQGRADEFTTRRPGERKRILAEILGLATFDELEARARARRGELDQEVKLLTQRLSELQQEVARKPELAAAVQAHEEALAQVQTELHVSQEHLAQLQQRRSALDLQSQRAQDVARRLRQLQREHLDIAQHMAPHRQRIADYEAVLQQEQAIVAGYQMLQHLREQDRIVSAQAEAYTTLHQRLTTLQQAVAMAQHRLEIECQSLSERSGEIDHKMQECEILLLEAPQVVHAYNEFQEARRRDTEMAQALQQRYSLEQEKSLVERRIQQKRHALELEQRSLLDRRDEWQRKKATLPTLQQQADEAQRLLVLVEQHEGRLEQIRTTGVSLKVQLETTLPQMRETLQREIDEQDEKRKLLGAAGAHCPLCEKALTEPERRRVMHKLTQEVARREQRIRELQEEQRQFEAQRQQLRVEYKQVEQQAGRRRELEQQYATLQATLTEATRARDDLVTVLHTLQEIDTRLQVGNYAAEDLSRLRQLTAELDQLAYDPQAHAAVRQTLARLAEAEVRKARVQQAEAEVVVLRQQQHDLMQQRTALAQTLQTRQYALAEQRELQEVSEQLTRLNFHPAAYSALRQQLQEQQHSERQYLQLETAREHLAEERAALQILEAKQQQMTLDIATLEQEQRQFTDELRSLEAVRTDTTRTEQLVQTLREREGQIRFTLGRSQSQYEHCLQREVELQQRHQQHQQAVDERALYGDLAVLFGKNGIQAIIIENAIPELEEETNRILARVTNNAMHLKLETQRDTRAGGVVETLDIKISDGLGTRNYELYSGGEAFRINFALRIALSKLLARRAGARLRTLVIDEGFGTQDTQGLERLVEVIKAIQDDFAKIIVITHLRELKNAFETHIEVCKDPISGSSYQVV
jgi:exonuclease SbcC